MVFRLECGKRQSRVRLPMRQTAKNGHPVLLDMLAQLDSLSRMILRILYRQTFHPVLKTSSIYPIPRSYNSSFDLAFFHRVSMNARSLSSQRPRSSLFSTNATVRLCQSASCSVDDMVFVSLLHAAFFNNHSISIDTCLEQNLLRHPQLPITIRGFLTTYLDGVQPCAPRPDKS